MKYTSSILLSLKRNTLFWKSTSNILPSLNINAQICKVYFKFYMKVWVELEYYLNSDNEGKKQYKEKLILSNRELLPDPNVLDIYWMEGRSSLST